VIITSTASQARVETDRAYAAAHPVEPVRFSHLADRTDSAREQLPHDQALVVLFRAPSGPPLSLVA
jgi:hypothetical protein